MKKNAVVISAMMFALVYNAPIVANADLAAAKGGNVWGQTGSAWYGTAFFSFGPKLTNPNTRVSETRVLEMTGLWKGSQKEIQLPGPDLDQQLKIQRALAASA